MAHIAKVSSLSASVHAYVCADVLILFAHIYYAAGTLSSHIPLMLFDHTHSSDEHVALVAQQQLRARCS